MKKYSENGLWIEKEADSFRIGLSSKGQDDLGVISFAELLKQDCLTTEDSLISVEAAKAVTELLSPVSGTVVRWHDAVEDQPELLNESDSHKNWIVEITEVPTSQWNALLQHDLPIESEQ